MKSALTRRVFRQLLHSEPLVHPQCLHSPSYRSRRKLSQTATHQRFWDWTWGFFGEPRQHRELKPENVDPGFHKMVELSLHLRQNVRPPPREDLIEAVTAFFASRAKGRVDGKTPHKLSTRLTDLQVEYALTALRHLRESDGKTGLTVVTLCQVLASCTPPPFGGPKLDLPRTDLVQMVFTELAASWEEHFQQYKSLSEEEQINTLGDNFQKYYARVPQLYFLCMAYYGPPEEYLHRLLHHLEFRKERYFTAVYWRHTMRCAARLGDSFRLDQLVEQAASDRGNFDEGAQHAVVQAFVAAKDLKAAKKWYEQSIVGEFAAEKARPTNIMPHVSTMVFWLCLEQNDLEYARQIVDMLLAKADGTRVPGYRDWRLILALAAAEGKTVADITQMFEVIQERGPPVGAEWKKKTWASFIGPLVSVAKLQGDLARGEQFLSLGQSLGFGPDFAAYYAIFELRLHHGDIQNAVLAYRKLQRISENTEKMAELGNKLVVGLAKHGSEAEDIMEIVTELIGVQVFFDPAVVAVLSVLHLQRDELHDAIDVIRTHAMQFDKQGRQEVREAVFSFCLDEKTTPKRSWDSYLILHELFEQETTREHREVIMKKVFGQGRADIAMHVFGHLRQSPFAYRRPSLATYALCFEGIANTGGDEDILRIVHNMLKLDQEIDPDTKVNNSLMLAYIAAGQSQNAMEIWNDILQSKEGPTPNSIRIALMATEKSPRRQESIEGIWQRASELGVHGDRNLYISYVWTLASNGQLEKALSMLDDFPVTFTEPAEAKLSKIDLAVLANVVPAAELDRLVEWATKHHLETWEDALALPRIRPREMFLRVLLDADRGISP